MDSAQSPITSDLNTDDDESETIGQMKRELSQPEIPAVISPPEGILSYHLYSLRLDTLYELHSSRYFSYPLYRVAALDMTGDGIDELMVSGLHGLHFLQVTMNSLLSNANSCSQMLGLSMPPSHHG